MNLDKALASIEPRCFFTEQKVKSILDSIAKPLHSLGILEDCLAKIGSIQKTSSVNLDRRALVIMCADNGVTAQGVTQADSIITTIVAENCTKGITSACVMAEHLNIDVYTVDIGIKTDTKTAGIINKKIMNGTKDFTIGPAMNRDQCLQAIKVGINIAMNLSKKGYKVILTGEMGIGNTTTSAAVLSCLSGLDPEVVTGRGAGLNDDGLKRKINAIKKGIAINKPSKEDPIDVLSKVGGLDIAGIVGLFIGGALSKTTVLIDGVISGVAALIAVQLNKDIKDYIIATHLSKEPAGNVILNMLGMKPFINAELCLGEGSGAIAGMSLIDLALVVYNKAVKFTDTNIVQYTIPN